MSPFEDIRHSIHSLAQKVHECNSSSSSIHSSSDSRGLAADGSRAVYDAELEDLDSLILDLTSGIREFRARTAARRNTFLPVHKLLPEILSTVFELYTSLTEESPRHLHPAFTLSWVCAYWRAIALDCSAVWSSFGLSAVSLPVAELLFQRSRQHPLRVLHCDIDIRANIQALILDNSYRTKDLAMSIQQFSYSHDLVSGDLPFVGSCLERLSLRFSRKGPRSIQRGPSLRVLTSPLFPSGAPHLRHVVLDGGRIPWNTGYLRNLSTLKISQCSVGAITLNDSDICLVLRDSPNLEVLDLVLYKDAHWDPQTDRLVAPHAPGERTPLASLHTLHLDVPVHYAHHLFLNFDMTSLRILTVNLGTMDEHDAPSANLFAPGLLPTHLVSSLNYFEAWCDHGHAETGGVSGSSSSEKTVLELQWSGGGDRGFNTDLRILRWIAESLRDDHDTHFTDLELACDLGFSSLRFCSILARTPTLTSLRLVGSAAVSTISSTVTGTVGDWPNLTHVAVESKLSYDEALAIIIWCHKRRSLTALDLSGSSVSEYWVNQPTPFAFWVRELGFKVKAEAIHTRSYDPGYVNIRAVIPPDTLMH